MKTCPRCGHIQEDLLTACELCGVDIDKVAESGSLEIHPAPLPSGDHWAYEDPGLLGLDDDNAAKSAQPDAPPRQETSRDIKTPEQASQTERPQQETPPDDIPNQTKPRYMASPTVARPNPKRYEPFVIKNAQGERMSRGTRALNMLVWTLSYMLVAAIVLFALYKGSLWAHSLWINHFYEIRPGESAPTAEEIVLEDGRGAYKLTFFGRDGEVILLDQIRRTYLIAGGKVEIIVPHNEWFESQPLEVESLEVTLTPVRQSLSGAKALLPPLVFTVTAPQSPVQLIQPATLHQLVFKSIYNIQLRVLPGSVVFVGGRDVTDLISVTGALSVNQQVGMGENVVSILVRSENQRENRIDLVLERPLMDIDTYLDYSVADRSSTGLFRVTGKTEPGAGIEVKTPHNQSSVKVDSHGNFAFTARFDRVGYNTVRFDVSMEGRRDGHVEFEVLYMPSVDEYSRKAWVMDYEKLKDLFEDWIGVIFLCDGYVIETVSLDPQWFVMNMGSEANPKLVLLENQSNIATAETGIRYKAFADVTGMERYQDDYIPTLTTRYMIKQ